MPGCRVTVRMLQIGALLVVGPPPAEAAACSRRPASAGRPMLIKAGTWHTMAAAPQNEWAYYKRGGYS